MIGLRRRGSREKKNLKISYEITGLWDIRASQNGEIYPSTPRKISIQNQQTWGTNLVSNFYFHSSGFREAGAVKWVSGLGLKFRVEDLSL